MPWLGNVGSAIEKLRKKTVASKRIAREKKNIKNPQKPTKKLFKVAFVKNLHKKTMTHFKVFGKWMERYTGAYDYSYRCLQLYKISYGSKVY